MQEQMNSMNDSGQFQGVESNRSGRVSYVSSQPTVIPSSRSMLSRAKRLPLDTWNTSGLQENVFGNQFLYVWLTPRSSLSRNSALRTTKRTRISSTSYRDRDHIHKRIILGLENTFQKSRDYLFRFSLGSNVMDRRGGDGRFNGGIEVIAISCGQECSKFRDAGRWDCFCSEQDHPEFTIQEEGQSRGPESPEAGPVSAGKTDRNHDLRLLSSNGCAWYSIRLCWFILYHSSWR